MILVLNLYLKLPFGKMDRRNPDVIHLANIIGRTPNAVALRLVNHASYDPQLQRRGIAGMAHGGKKCGEYWSEFVNDRERLLFESERSYIANVSRLTGIDPDEPIGIPSVSPSRWMAVGVAMAIQENGTTSIDWFAMLRGWEMCK